MRRTVIAVVIATLAAGPAAALEAPPLCKALHGLGEEARTSGAAQRISADVDTAAPAACRPVTDNPAARAFCDAAAHEAGLAWRLYDCENSMAADPQVTTRAEHAEHRTRKAITHLAAKLAHGVRVDLSETGGRYDIVVWAPK
ncbi:MAG TPA: hypothetical protein VGC92_17340 [Phenylobacterium sp.]